MIYVYKIPNNETCANQSRFLFCNYSSFEATLPRDYRTTKIYKVLIYNNNYKRHQLCIRENQTSLNFLGYN